MSSGVAESSAVVSSAVVSSAVVSSQVSSSGPCDPNITLYYVRYTESSSTSYFTVTGSLNSGVFSGTSPNGAFTLTWNPGTGDWEVSDAVIGTLTPVGNTLRCDPEETYGVVDPEVEISATPLP